MRLLKYLCVLFVMAITTPAIAQTSLASLPSASSASGRSVPCPIPGTAGSSQLCTPAQIVNSVSAIQIGGAGNNGPFNIQAPNGAATTGFLSNSGDPTTNWFVLRDAYPGNRQSGFGSMGYTSAATGNGSTATYTYTGAAMTVGHTLVAVGFVPAAFNGSFTITAASANSVTVTSTANGTATTQGYFWDASAAGNGSGPRLDFQSPNSVGVIRDSAGINCGLISATAGSESTDCDFDGWRSGANSVLAALDASRPAFVPGVDNVWSLGDISLGGAHSLNRWSYGYFYNSVCVACVNAVPTSPFQANVAANSNIGVDLEASSGYIKLIPSFSNVAYNGTVVAGDTGILYPSGGHFDIIPASGATSGFRMDGSGNLVETGNITASGLITGTGGFAGAINGTVGATTPNTGAFTTIAASGLVTGSGGFAGAINGTVGATTPNTGAFTTIAASGVITSTLATGTAPFVVASTTNVANLNASSLGGATFASPGAIGGTTPGTGAFTTLTASGNVTGSGKVIAPYFTVTGVTPTNSGTCTINTQVGAYSAGSYKFSAACASGTVILSMGTSATNGWACLVTDMTTAGASIRETAYTTGAVTYTVTSAASGDQVVYSCTGF